MPKLIITESQYNRITARLSEEIDPSEAYRDETSLQTIIDGKRGVGFFAGVGFNMLKKLENSGLNLIPIGKNRAYVAYSNGHEENAQRLAGISRKNGGYLPIEKPEETYVIGILLGYNKDKVKQFVKDKFPDFVFY